MQSCLKNPPDLRPGSVIRSPANCYQLQEHLDSGVYGKVVKCQNLTAQRSSVLKVLQIQNAGPKWQEEVKILQTMAKHQGHSKPIVQWFHSFHASGHFFHEFEKLDISLKQFVMQSPNKSLGLREIRPIVSQMAQALSFLKALGIMHNDVKLDNIMLVDHLRKPLSVKLIDFGLASTENCQGRQIQSRSFRPPEVFLGAPVDSAADMWALGIVAVSMFLGRVPLPGHSDEDMMRHIVETVGHCPEAVMDSGLYTIMYYTLSSSGKWEFKFPPLKPEQKVLHRLDDIHRSDRPGRPVVHNEPRDLHAFVHLVKEMLDPNPATRITPEAVMSHPFVSMRHLVRGNQCYHESSYDAMHFANCIIKKKAPLNNSGLTQNVRTVPVSVPEKRKRTESQEDDCHGLDSQRKRAKIQEPITRGREPDTTLVRANLLAPDPQKGLKPSRPNTETPSAQEDQQRPPKSVQERTGRTSYKTASPPNTKGTCCEGDQERTLGKRVKKIQEGYTTDQPCPKSPRARTSFHGDQQRNFMEKEMKVTSTSENASPSPPFI